MLTGPVTILAWSFVRDDQPLGETANQVALALRDEIADLEAAGIRSSRWTSPRCASCCRCARRTRPPTWTGRSSSFRLATAGAADAHPDPHPPLLLGVRRHHRRDRRPRRRRHLDRGRALPHGGRPRPRGARLRPRHRPGRLRHPLAARPGRAEVTELLETAVKHVPCRQLWVNPDCGLKTRGYAETEESLRNLVTATRTVRAGLLEAAK